MGGGGTDLPVYYRRFGGSLLTATIDKYVYIFVKQRFEDDIRVSYSRTEIVGTVGDVQHPVAREALRLTGITGGIEIVSVADVPAGSGLGTSSSFAVGLLAALHAYKGDNPSARDLAEEAFRIERVILGEPGGLQDQYAAAYGGVIAIEVATDGAVSVHPLRLDPGWLTELESRLLFFYTRFQRHAGQIQAGHIQAIGNEDEGVVHSLHRIKEIGMETRKALEAGDVEKFGRLLHEHWNHKKGIGDNISNRAIDRWYQIARDAGALGGKLIGAGGGGFLMFCCAQGCRERVRAQLCQQGLKEMRVRFEPAGSRILMNL